MEQQLQQQERVERLVTQYEGVLGVLARESTDTRTGREVRALFGSRQEIESARSECLTVKSWTGSNYLPLRFHCENASPNNWRVLWFSREALFIGVWRHRVMAKTARK